MVYFDMAGNPVIEPAPPSFKKAISLQAGEGMAELHQIWMKGKAHSLCQSKYGPAACASKLYINTSSGEVNAECVSTTDTVKEGK
jgi:hypothetical protein